MRSNKPTRANIGCGRNSTPGWTNIDSSPSVRLAHHPIVTSILTRLGLLRGENQKLIQMAREAGIIHGNALKLSMLPDCSMEVVYSSHMMQQLDRDEARAFLAEIRRVLIPGGIIRLAMPDLELLVKRYLETHDADELVRKTWLWFKKPKNFMQRISLFLFGVRSTSCWSYDGRSLCKLLTETGFHDAQVLPAGQTRIPDPGSLDLTERANETVYVEAIKPS